jgi:hypothetical protein
VNEKLLASFSPSAQRALRALASSPEDAVSFYNRLVVFHAALKIGLEVIEAGAKGLHSTDVIGREAAAHGARAALGASTAIECCMSVLQEIHPGAVGRSNKSKPPGDCSTGSPEDADYIAERFKRLDLD